MLKIQAFGFQKQQHLQAYRYEPDLQKFQKIKLLRFAFKSIKGTVEQLKDQLRSHLKSVYGHTVYDLCVQLLDGYDISDDIKVSRLPTNELRVLYVENQSRQSVQSILQSEGETVMSEPPQSNRKARKQKARKHKAKKKSQLFELVNSEPTVERESSEVNSQEIAEPINADVDTLKSDNAVTNDLVPKVQEPDTSQPSKAQSDEVPPESRNADSQNQQDEEPHIKQTQDPKPAQPAPEPQSQEVPKVEEADVSDVSSVSSVSTASLSSDLSAPVLQSKPSSALFVETEDIQDSQVQSDDQQVIPEETQVAKTEQLHQDEHIVPEQVHTPVIQKQTMQRLPRLSDLRVHCSIPGTPVATDDSEQEDAESEDSESSTKATNRKGLFALAKQQHKTVIPKSVTEKSLLKSSHPILQKPVLSQNVKPKKRKRKITLPPPDHVPSTLDEVQAILQDDSKWVKSR